MNRSLPNIIVTGTPGCGKSTHAHKLSEALGFKKHSISDLAKEKGFIESYDEILETSIVDEDKLLDFMEGELTKGGQIVDWHVCDIFPERLIDLVVVLTVDNGKLYDRLVERGYKKNKIDENIDAEIMQVVLGDARESYAPEVVVVLESNEIEEIEGNVERIIEWVENWKRDHGEGVSNERRGMDGDDGEAEDDEEDDDEDDGEAEEEDEKDDKDDEEEDFDDEGEEQSEEDSVSEKDSVSEEASVEDSEELPHQPKTKKQRNN